MKKTPALWLVLIGITAIAFVWISLAKTTKKTIVLHRQKYQPHDALPMDQLTHLSIKAREARTFARSRHFNTSLCFLIDMRIPSNHKRMFVYDMQKDSVVQAGLVTHGRCHENWLYGRKFGNEIGCGCTSLGKYQIGASYSGRFGPAFKLHGMENSNNNAFARYVVLHGHQCVPNKEIMDEICQSDGCPTVAPQFLHLISPLIKDSKKPVLLWIFN